MLSDGHDRYVESDHTALTVAKSTRGRRSRAGSGHPTDAPSTISGQGPIADVGHTPGARTKNGADPSAPNAAIARSPHRTRKRGQLVPAAESGHLPSAPTNESGRDHDVDSDHSVSAAQDGAVGRAPHAAESIEPRGEVEGGRVVAAGDGHKRRAVFDSLLTLHRLREDYHRAEKRLFLQLLATCRRRCGGDKKAARVMFKALERAPDLEVAPMFAALGLLRENRKSHERAMERIAKGLHIAPWVESVPGLNHLSAAQIVAELACLLVPAAPATPESAIDEVPAEEATSTPGQPRHVDSDHRAVAWRRVQESRAMKRMGVALVNGERQRRTKDKDLAEAMGYSPRRRSILYVIGENLIRAGKKPNSRYYEMYCARKEYELARGLKRGHAHNRAKRYAEKRLIRHFLAAWNVGTTVQVAP